MALLGLLFRSLISPATYLLGLSWLQVRPTVAFRASEAGATSRLPAAQRLRVASARTRTRTRSRAPRGPSPRADAAAPVPATCRAWHLLLFGSWQLRFSFCLPSLRSPPPGPTRYTRRVCKFPPDSRWASLIFLLLLSLLQTLDASKAGKNKK